MMGLSITATGSPAHEIADGPFLAVNLSRGVASTIYLYVILLVALVQAGWLDDISHGCNKAFRKGDGLWRAYVGLSDVSPVFFLLGITDYRRR